VRSFCYFALPPEFPACPKQENTMNRFTKWLSMLALITIVVALCVTGALAADPSGLAKYVVTNDDNPNGNTATFFSVAASGKLTLKKTVSTGGTGLGGGYFGSTKANVSHSKTQECAYVGNATSSNVSAIDIVNFKNNGPYAAGPNDSGKADGISLVSATTGWVYAGFSGASAGDGTGSIAAYKELAGCKLKYEKSVPAKGLGLGIFGVGSPSGIAVTPNQKLLIVAYADGSIQSFNIATGIPKANGPAVSSTGFASGDYPGGVDVTADGKYYLLADIPTTTTSGAVVEVGEISKIKKGTTTVYGPIQTGFNSDVANFSPDETLIYINNNQGGTVTAAGFDKANGKVTSTSCISSALSGFDTNWFYLGTLTTQNTQTGNGAYVYTGELGFGTTPGSGVGIVKVKATKSSCSLTEASFSPAADNGAYVMGIAAYPPRPF
jgi:hypothetical protein